MHFMSTACGSPQGDGGGQSHVDACVRGGGKKSDFLVVVINV